MFRGPIWVWKPYHHTTMSIADDCPSRKRHNCRKVAELWNALNHGTLTAEEALALAPIEGHTFQSFRWNRRRLGYTSGWCSPGMEITPATKRSVGIAGIITAFTFQIHDAPRYLVRFLRWFPWSHRSACISQAWECEKGWGYSTWRKKAYGLLLPNNCFFNLASKLRTTPRQLS